MSEARIYTEGVCSDGAAILRHGFMLRIEEVIATLNDQAAEIARLHAAHAQAADTALAYAAERSTLALQHAAVLAEIKREREEAVRVLEPVVDVLDAFGALPDTLMDPNAWRRNGAGPKLAAARAFLDQMKGGGIAGEPRADAVKIKPLEWGEIYYNRSDEEPIPEMIGWSAETEVGIYYVKLEIDIEVSLDGFQFYKVGSFQEIEAAKAAAQKDYEARIRAALTDGGVHG